ncbi:rp2 [Symbiodinium sp. CCMP2592]|nr:rp2 [Symbiodinium sp. CCMP2592]
MAPQRHPGEEPLLLLRESLVAFRSDLEVLFQAQQRHNNTRRQLQDLYVRLLWTRQNADPEPTSASTQVGIAGVGKLSDSPNSKGARAKKHSINLESFGGEDELRSLVLRFLANEKTATHLPHDSIQDIWADELSASSARVSALIRDGMRSDCWQFVLAKEGSRWEYRNFDSVALLLAWHVLQQNDLSIVQEPLDQQAGVPQALKAAIELVESDPSKGHSFAELASCLGPDHTVSVLGDEYDVKKLYIKALKLDPSLNVAKEQLGKLLQEGEEVRIRGKVFTKSSLTASAASEAGTAEPDLWDKVASDISPALAEAQLTRKLLESEAQISRDLWSPVAAEIESGKLRKDFDLIRAKAMETPPVRRSQSELEIASCSFPPLAATVDENKEVAMSTPTSTIYVDPSPDAGIRFGVTTPDTAALPSATPAWSVQDTDLAVAKAATTRKKSDSTLPSTLRGMSPLHRPKDVGKLFEEMDADGDGFLGEEDLMSYLRDYLRYGEAEVMAFLHAHQQDGRVDLPAFKRSLKELQPYAIHDRFNKTIVRKPGAFGGLDCVDFHVEDCSGCTCLVCEKSSEFHADGLVDCRLVIGPCENSTFVRNCENCTFWVATKQFRVRECINCTFYLHCHTEPIIESSKDLRVAPFCAEYPGLSQQFREAKFDPTKNFWNAIYDFTGKAESANWQIPSLDACEKLIVSFRGCSDAPDGPAPELTQALLCADPLVSGESQGQSMANIPQTRPALPGKPGRQRLQRLMSDAANEDVGGRLQEALEDEPLFSSVSQVEKSMQSRQDPQSSSDEVEILDLEEEEEDSAKWQTRLPSTKEGEWRPGAAHAPLASHPSRPAQQKARAAMAAAAEASLAPLQRGGGPGNLAAKRPLGGLRLSMAPSKNSKTDTKAPADSSDDDETYLPCTKAPAKPTRPAASAATISSIDSDDDDAQMEGSSALTARQRSLLAHGLTGLGAFGLQPRLSSSDEERTVPKARRDLPPEQTKRLADRSQTGNDQTQSDSTSDD